MDLADIRVDPHPGHRPNVMDFSLLSISYLTKFGENPLIASCMTNVRKYHKMPYLVHG